MWVCVFSEHSFFVQLTLGGGTQGWRGRWGGYEAVTIINNGRVWVRLTVKTWIHHPSQDTSDCHQNEASVTSPLGWSTLRQEDRGERGERVWRFYCWRLTWVQSLHLAVSLTLHIFPLSRTLQRSERHRQRDLLLAEEARDILYWFVNLSLTICAVYQELVVHGNIFFLHFSISRIPVRYRNLVITLHSFQSFPENPVPTFPGAVMISIPILGASDGITLTMGQLADGILGSSKFTLISCLIMLVMNQDKYFNRRMIRAYQHQSDGHLCGQLCVSPLR